MSLITETDLKELKNELYGSFFIDEVEFALHVDGIQEVVNLPEKIIKTPLSPSFLIGVFNLRGIVIPVVDLRNLLKLNSAKNLELCKVAIIEHQGVRVGLLFDSTGEILRVRSEDISDFQYENASVNKVIQGAIKLENGERLLQIIDAMAVVNIENIPHVLENQKKMMFASENRHGQRKKCISFSSAGISMAFEIGGIHEILRVPEIQHSALVSKICVGMTTLRGQVIPLIDFSKMIGEEGESVIDGADRRIIVLKIENEYFGLLVDSVDNISSYYQKDLMPIPLLTKERSEMFQGCLDFPDREVILLDHRQILSNKEIIEITHGHSNIYQSQDSLSKVSKKTTHRQVYILFHLDQLFGVSIQDVKEIIDCPKDLTSTPGMHSFIRGVMNLRGQLVTIVETRKLYKLPATEPADPKVLIFQSGSEKFGLIVDSVDSILSVTEDQKIELPSLLYTQAAETYQKDIKEAVEVTSLSGKRTSVIILNVAPIVERIRIGA